MSVNLEAYQQYFDEYLTEAEDEVETKALPYKKNFFLRDNLLNKYLAPVLSKPGKRDFIFKFTAKFMDDHNNQLSTSGPVHMFTFGAKEIAPIYELFGIDASILLQLFQELQVETYDGKLAKPYHGLINEVPHKLLLAGMIMYGLQNNHEEIIESAKYLFAFTEYPIIYRKFWRLGVKEDVMNYTIEHLPSTKFKAKKVNNLRGLLKMDMDKSVEKHESDFKDGIDNVYLDFIMRVRNQIKNTFKNISIQYYANYDSDATQHTKDGKMDDGSLSEIEGHTSNIASVVENTYNKININPINKRLISVVSEHNAVDPANVTSYLNQIFGEKNNRLYRMIENIITAYLNKKPTNTSVGSGEFLSFGLALYRSIATSKNTLYHEIRQIKDLWMFEIINIKEYYSNEGTISNYSRAIFNYIIWLINSYN